MCLMLIQHLTDNKPSVNLPSVVMAPSISTIIVAMETQHWPVTVFPQPKFRLSSVPHPVYLSSIPMAFLLAVVTVHRTVQR